MNLYTSIIIIHSIVRWIFLIMLVYSVSILYTKWIGGKELSSNNKRINTIVVVLSHLQLIVGISLYLVSPKVVFASYMFQSNLLRFFTMEHSLLMIAAIAILTIGNIKSKRNNDSIKSVKQCTIWFSIALVIILISIPWPFLQYGTKWI